MVQNIVIVGPPRSGKTLLAHGLYDQLTKLKHVVHLRGEGYMFSKGLENPNPEIVIWDKTPTPDVQNDFKTRFIAVPALYC